MLFGRIEHGKDGCRAWSKFVAERQKSMGDNKTQGKLGAGKVLLVVAAVVIFMWHMGAVNDAKHIEAVLAQDKTLSETLNSRMNDQKTDSVEDFDRIALYLDAFVEQEQRIDTHECPREFTEAYARYLAAFSGESAVLHAHPHVPSGEEAVALGVIKGLHGDARGELREIKDSLDSWQKSWHATADQATLAEHQMREVAAHYELTSWPRFD